MRGARISLVVPLTAACLDQETFWDAHRRWYAFGSLPCDSWPRFYSELPTHISVKMSAALSTIVREVFEAANAVHDASKASLDSAT